MRTKADRLQVTLGGRTLRSVAPPAAAPLRARTWRPMRVRHARRSAGLSVWLDDVLLVSGVLLPGFAPTEHWRFGFGARSGPNYAMLEERHDVRLFRVALGAGLTALDLAPEISLNAQQYVAAEGLGPSLAGNPFLDGDGFVSLGLDLEIGSTSVGAAATFAAVAARSRSRRLGLGVDAANTSFTLTAPAIRVRVRVRVRVC